MLSGAHTVASTRGLPRSPINGSLGARPGAKPTVTATISGDRLEAPPERIFIHALAQGVRCEQAYADTIQQIDEPLARATCLVRSHSREAFEVAKAHDLEAVACLPRALSMAAFACKDDAARAELVREIPLLQAPQQAPTWHDMLAHNEAGPRELAALVHTLRVLPDSELDASAHAVFSEVKKLPELSRTTVVEHIAIDAQREGLGKPASALLPLSINLAVHLVQIPGELHDEKLLIKNAVNILPIVEKTDHLIERGQESSNLKALLGRNINYAPAGDALRKRLAAIRTRPNFTTAEQRLAAQLQASMTKTRRRLACLQANDTLRSRLLALIKPGPRRDLKTSIQRAQSYLNNAEYYAHHLSEVSGRASFRDEELADFDLRSQAVCEDVHINLESRADTTVMQQAEQLFQTHSLHPETVAVIADTARPDVEKTACTAADLYLFTSLQKRLSSPTTIWRGPIAARLSSVERQLEMG